MKKILALILVLCLVLSLAACGGNVKKPDPSNSPLVTENSESSDKILVYLSGPAAMLKKIENEFEAIHGDVVDLTIMSCGELRNKIWAESEAGNIQADVVWGSDPVVYNKLSAKDALEPIKLKEDSAIAKEYQIEDKNYILVNERYIALMYNTNLVKSAPKSFKDLQSSEYKNKLTMADASQSSTAFAIAASLYELMGDNDSYFKSLKENEIKLNKSNGLVPSSIIEGQFAAGIAPHDAYVRLKNKAKKEGYEIPVAISYPSEGVIAIQRPVAIPRNENRSAEKSKIANAFVNFLVSKKAQSITNKFGFVSVRNDIPNKFLPEGTTAYKVDWNKACTNESKIKNEYDAIFH